MTKVWVPLADGVEEMEAVIIVDVLRRAGLEVAAVGLDAPEVRASRGVRLLADAVWDQSPPADCDALVLPGGADGTDRLAADRRVLAAVRRLADDGRLLAAICAAPLVLQAAGVLAGRRVTCYPSLAGRLSGCRWVDEKVVVDGRFITSQGPGTAMAFALAVAAALAGAERAAAVGQAILYDD